MDSSVNVFTLEEWDKYLSLQFPSYSVLLVHLNNDVELVQILYYKGIFFVHWKKNLFHHRVANVIRGIPAVDNVAYSSGEKDALNNQFMFGPRGMSACTPLIALILAFM